MCRYAVKTYKSHYVCFTCRKSFKQPAVYDILRRIEKEKVYHEPDGKSINIGSVFVNRKESRLFKLPNTEEGKELVSTLENRVIRCPECRSIMADLGKDFKAPKKTAAKEWKIIESLFKTGKCFHSCGCDGIGYIPKNPMDYQVYLKTILQDYQVSLTACQKIPIEEFPDKAEEIKYWSDRIQRIKTEIIDNKFEIM
ncbi:hypothetical protein [Chryseobacterium sp. ON_d1]|uniref:hypothetical protein n=1 Tax=Chryseobacterium sp. ON_d1 TaxID=2583211 RepID=UPI00115ADAB2|nr:hypothetical protein [Chryseobacterium sp. ON_d1]GEJ46399.1 hypothetical protein CRS_30070 [Chryseobacterium sp. ON_d1]